MNPSKIQGLAVLLTALLPLSAPGQTPPPPPVPPATLIQQLGDDTFEVLGAGKFKEAFAFALEMIPHTEDGANAAE